MFNWWKKQNPKNDGGDQKTEPDFSDVDKTKAEKMLRLGELEKLHLIPLEFGGQDIPPNIVYVPLGVAELKSKTDQNVIAPLIAEGKVTKYQASPEYQGNSFVPIRIRIRANDSDSGGDFSSEINIWGNALALGASKRT